MLLSEMLVPTYRQMLGTLSAWLTKAEGALPGGGADALLRARLAPDMFPLATQVVFACRQVAEGMYRLKGEPFPAAIDTLLEEGREPEGKIDTIADAQARITATLAMMEEIAATLGPVEHDAALPHELPIGMIFDFDAGQYTRDWALPQFFFHVMIAYAILRANGVQLGKADYVGHLLPYIRPGTVPGQ